MTKPCTCTGTCKGADGLGELWHCVMEENRAAWQQCQDAINRHRPETTMTLSTLQAEKQATLKRHAEELAEIERRIESERDRDELLWKQPAWYSDYCRLFGTCGEWLTTNEGWRESMGLFVRSVRTRYAQAPAATVNSTPVDVDRLAMVAAAGLLHMCGKATQEQLYEAIKKSWLYKAAAAVQTAGSELFAAELKALREKFPGCAVKIGVEMAADSHQVSYAAMVAGRWYLENTLSAAMRHFIPDWQEQPATPAACSPEFVEKAAEAIFDLCKWETVHDGSRMTIGERGQGPHSREQAVPLIAAELRKAWEGDGNG